MFVPVSLARLVDFVRDGRLFMIDALAISFGELTETSTVADLRGVAFTAAQAREADWLLGPAAAARFNLTADERRELAALKSTVPGP